MTAPPKSEFELLPFSRPPKGAPEPKIYRVQRQFSLPSIFVMTTLLAIACAILQFWEARAEVYVFIAIMTAVTCAAQIFVPGSPRAASMVSGAVVMVALQLMALIFDPPRRTTPFVQLSLLLSGIISGVLVGYMFGTLAASVFLTDRLFRRKPQE